jgi:hypothetical protein
MPRRRLCASTKELLPRTELRGDSGLRYWGLCRAVVRPSIEREYANLVHSRISHSGNLHLVSQTIKNQLFAVLVNTG